MPSSTPRYWARPDSKRADDALRGKCALIVDDDVRKLFALTGLLEDAGMEVNAIPASTSFSWTS